MDRQRAQQLDHIVRKMGGIASVFEIRSDPVGNSAFSAMREIMDVYIDLCGDALKNDQDFIDEGVNLDSGEGYRDRLRGAFERVFGVPPGSI